MIEKLAIKSGAMKEVQSKESNNTSTVYDGTIVRVLLTDTSQMIVTGSGLKYSIRDHMYKYNEVDILIDAKKPLVEAVTFWAQQTYAKLITRSPTAKPIIIFNTNNQEYFKTLKSVLDEKGWTVLDETHRDDETYLELVYQNTTSDTVNSKYSLYMFIEKVIFTYKTNFL